MSAIVKPNAIVYQTIYLFIFFFFAKVNRIYGFLSLVVETPIGNYE